MTIDIAAANDLLRDSRPQDIIEWAIDNVEGLFQTTALGLTGMAGLDMISHLARKRKLDTHPVPLIFLDTLYHFQETYDLLHRAEKKYKVKFNVFKPLGADNVAQFEELYGKELWTKDEDSYDYLVKVEPSRRAYETLGVKAVITGRRKSQGGDRATLEPIEVDSTGLIKINPLCNWSFNEVKDYIDMAGVPYNVLLDQGYKSIGDWHSTAIPKEGESERAGRWANNAGKTECGLHKDYYKMKHAFSKKQREKELAAKDETRGDVSIEPSIVSTELN